MIPAGEMAGGRVSFFDAAGYMSKSPFAPPTPLLSPLPPPTPIPPPTPFASSRPSDPVTPSVRCAFTDTGPCDRAVGCSQAPLPVCRDVDSCGMKGPVVEQIRIAAEGVLLPSLPSDVGTR